MSQNFYADSSVLVKRHVQEIGSVWFQNLVLPASNNEIITSKISIVEVFSAFNRRRREASISRIDYNDFAKDFLAISNNEYHLLDLNDSIIAESQRLWKLTRYARAMQFNLRLPSIPEICFKIPGFQPQSFWLRTTNCLMPPKPNNLIPTIRFFIRENIRLVIVNRRDDATIFN